MKYRYLNALASVCIHNEPVQMFPLPTATLVPTRPSSSCPAQTWKNNFSSVYTQHSMTEAVEKAGNLCRGTGRGPDIRIARAASKPPKRHSFLQLPMEDCTRNSLGKLEPKPGRVSPSSVLCHSHESKAAYQVTFFYLSQRVPSVGASITPKA